jgi:hypothetical protein
MSLHSQLKRNPPKLQVVGEVREIKIDLVSAMCDNKYRWTAKKKDDGDFVINTGRFAYSNFGIPHYKDDIEWAMDRDEWTRVFDMINEGTCQVERIQYR